MNVYRVITLSLITGVSLAVLLVCAQANGAEPVARKEQPLNLGKVVVSPTKTERRISDVPESVTLITKEDLEETTVRYVDDALRYEAGIDVDRGKGGLSSPSTFVYMRGFPHPRAVAVLMDGVPVNRAICGGVKWNEMPVNIVNRVEVMRGAGSTLYGSGAEAGVISIATEGPGDKAEFIIEETYGSHNTWESVATIKGPLIGDLGGFISYNHIQTDGFHPYAGSDPIFQATQRDNYRYADSLFGKLVYKFDDITSLSTSYSYWNDEVSMGRAYNHKDIERHRVIAGFKRKGDVFDVKINAFYLDEEFVDYMDNKKYQACGNLAQVRHRPGKDTGANLAVSFPLMEGQAFDQIFTVGGDYRWAEMEDKLNGMTKDKPILEKYETAKGKQHRASVFCQDEIEMGDLLLNLSARFDWYRSYGGHHYKKQWNPKKSCAVVVDDTGYSTKSDSAFNWKIGTVYHVTDSTALRGSFARAFHMPYLYSLYATTECPPGKVREGNPGLKPEYVLAYEAGVDQKIGEKATVRLTGFYNDITDWMEAAYRTSDGGKKYEWSNINKVVTSGLELEGEYKVTDDITLFANYTYLYTEIKKFKCPPASGTIGHPYAPGDYEGNRLPNQPGNKTNFGVIFDNPDILTFSLICRYVGQRFDDLENVNSMKSYFTADLLLAKKLTQFLEVSLEINDLFDETWQEDYDWLASPGRTIMGKVKLSF